MTHLSPAAAMRRALPPASAACTARGSKDVAKHVAEDIAECVSCRSATSAAPTTRRRYVTHQLIHWPLAGPRDAAEQHILNRRIVEIGVRMPLHIHKTASRLAARKRMFIGPDLRYNFAHVAGAPRVRWVYRRSWW